MLVTDRRRGRVIVLSYCGQAFCTLSLNALLLGAGTEVLLSAGKPAYASSQAPAGDCPASKGNDGNTSTIFHSGFSASGCNLDGSGPWWGVDLGGKRASGFWRRGCHVWRRGCHRLLTRR